MAYRKCVSTTRICTTHANTTQHYLASFSMQAKYFTLKFEWCKYFTSFVTLGNSEMFMHERNWSFWFSYDKLNVCWHCLTEPMLGIIHNYPYQFTLVQDLIINSNVHVLQSCLIFPWIMSIVHCLCSDNSFLILGWSKNHIFMNFFKIFHARQLIY